MTAVLLTLSLLLACGEKSTAPASNRDARPVVSLGSVDIPGDAKSKDFAKALLGTTIKEFRPTDGGGATLIYTVMRFANDNTWKAEAYVKVEDMQIECTESGTWSMTEAESNNSAAVAWSVNSTDCAGRSEGNETRALLTLVNGGIEDIQFR